MFVKFDHNSLGKNILPNIEHGTFQTVYRRTCDMGGNEIYSSRVQTIFRQLSEQHDQIGLGENVLVNEKMPLFLVAFLSFFNCLMWSSCLLAN
jgi:hypothetical protein